MFPDLEFIKTVLNGLRNRIENLSKEIDKKISYNLNVSKADWNQNDSTQPDYVKNRPFYTGDPVETVLVEESTVSFSLNEQNGLYVAQFPSTFEATVGETYKVSWDGTVYECTCTEVSGEPAIGNLSIDGSGPDTGEPFLMIVRNQEIDVATLNSNHYHTISISRFVPGVVVKIDPKYLPDNPLYITGATVGQIAKITAVDDTGKPTAWEAADMPTSLPNPNALTFTGAVTGSYDGSVAVTVDIPSGGGSTVNNNTINQYFYNPKVAGKYDLKSGYGTTADIYIAADGTETAISGLDYVATDYIPVGANTSYVAYCNGYALYDKEKTFVSTVIDRSNYGTIKEFTPEQDGYVRVTYRGSLFSRLCEKSEIKKAPRDYMPAPSPFFDIRIPCNVDLYGDSNSYGYGLSDQANAWANRLGALLLSMPEEVTNGARFEMSVFAASYNGDPKLRNNGVVYMSAYTDKFTVNGEYITAVDVYIDGVQQAQMTASPAEYTCPLGYHEIELRGSSGTNNVIRSIATNKTRSFTNHAVTGSKSQNLPDTVDGNVVIVMYGTNDRETVYGATANNMARFYSACEAAGAKVYFCSPIPTKTEGETDASYKQTISDVISQIPDINYIDVYKDMQLYSMLSTETLYSDKLHLNDLGHKILFCIVASKLHLAAPNSIFG